jgi:hypothetical protein
MIRLMTGIWLLATAAQAQLSKAPVATVEARLLAAHNGERARLGHMPLKWSAILTKEAGLWADTLAKTAQFEHANQSRHGENLWMGTKGAYSPEAMVALWIDERRLFKPGRFPDVSTNGKWTDVGHYTQLIWQSTSEVGCAIASNAEDDYLVCRYDPPGNWIGEEVLAPAAANQAPKPKPIRRQPR